MDDELKQILRGVITSSTVNVRALTTNSQTTVNNTTAITNSLSAPKPAVPVATPKAGSPLALVQALVANTAAVVQNTAARAGAVLPGAPKPKEDPKKKEKEAPDAPKAGGGMMGGLGSVLGVIKGFTAGLAVATGLLYTISHFVSAINPGAALLFNQALEDLQATIGSVLVPTLAIFTGVINEIAGNLLPVMQGFQPILTDLANFVANYVIGTLKFFLGILQSFTPVIAVLSKVMQVVSTIFQAWQRITIGPILTIVAGLLQVFAAILAPFVPLLQDFADIILLLVNVLNIAVKAIVDSLVAFVVDALDGTAIKDVMKDFGSALKRLVVNVIALAVVLSKFLGMAGVGNRIEKGLKEGSERKPKGLLSQKHLDPQIESIASVGNKIALAAAAAQMGGKGREDTQEDLLKQIVDAIKSYGDPKTLEDVIVTAGIKIWNEVKNKELPDIPKLGAFAPAAAASPFGGALALGKRLVNGD